MKVMTVLIPFWTLELREGDKNEAGDKDGHGQISLEGMAIVFLVVIIIGLINGIPGVRLTTMPLDGVEHLTLKRRRFQLFRLGTDS